MHCVVCSGKVCEFTKRLHWITYRPVVCLLTICQDGVLYKRLMDINEMALRPWPWAMTLITLAALIQVSNVILWQVLAKCSDGWPSSSKDHMDLMHINELGRVQVTPWHYWRWLVLAQTTQENWLYAHYARWLVWAHCTRWLVSCTLCMMTSFVHTCFMHTSGSCTPVFEFEFRNCVSP